MSHSLTAAQITMLRLAKRHLVLPGRDEGEVTQRNDLALLVMLKLVEPHQGGFRITAASTTCLERLNHRA